MADLGVSGPRAHRPRTGRSPGAGQRNPAQIPDNGIGYGLLRYTNAQTAPLLAQLPELVLSFNYLGRVGVAESRGWRLAHEPHGRGQAPDRRRPMPWRSRAALRRDRLRLTLIHGPSDPETWASSWKPTAPASKS